MKSTGTWSWNELQWLDLKIGHQKSSSSNGRHSDMLHSVICSILCILEKDDSKKNNQQSLLCNLCEVASMRDENLLLYIEIQDPFGFWMMI